jgi:hypothetical protein
MTRQTKLGLSATAMGIIVAFAALVAIVGSAFAAAGSASVDSPTADADGNATITLTMSTGVGNWAFDLGYIPADYTADPTCTTTLGAVTVKPEGAPGIVRFAGFDSTGNGVGGTVGSCTFDTNKTAGACSAITLGLAAKAGSAFEDTTGTAFAPATYTGGQICSAAAAATGTPTPSGGAATPTKTPGGVPQTGGPAGDSFQLGWVLALAGLVIVAAGAWTLARAREDN